MDVPHAMGRRMNVRSATVGVLVVSLVVSALAVVYAKHQSRKLLIELQQLQSERDRMNVDWGRLQLEQSTLATYQRIDSIAHGKLAMTIPSQDSVVIVGR